MIVTCIFTGNRKKRRKESMEQNSRLLRIGIFYDGNYFYHVSNYYCYVHQRRSRLSIPGLHEFVKSLISSREGVNERLCQIVDCHYFRGRLPAMEANARQILLNERIFDDILMREGVVTHYLPVTKGIEKGVDVSLALEALELTIFKHFNVVVLIASDGDYLPLVRKLNALGTRVVVLGWNFTYMDENGNERYTSTSAKLLNEASYPVPMHDYIDGRLKIDQRMNFDIDNLFVSSAQVAPPYVPLREGTQGNVSNQYDDSESQKTSQNSGKIIRQRGKIVQLKSGYGFLESENSKKDLFFFWQDVENADFNSLQTGDTLEYEPGSNDKGECARKILLID